MSSKCFIGQPLTHIGPDHHPIFQQLNIPSRKVISNVPPPVIDKHVVNKEKINKETVLKFQNALANQKQCSMFEELTGAIQIAQKKAFTTKIRTWNQVSIKLYSKEENCIIQDKNWLVSAVQALPN